VRSFFGINIAAENVRKNNDLAKSIFLAFDAIFFYSDKYCRPQTKKTYVTAGVAA